MSQSQSTRIGIVGCGAIADIYHLPALVANARTRDGLVLADPNEARIKELQQKYNAREIVTDYHDLIGKVDGVIVATPPALHHPIALFFLQQGINVLCEKPLTETLSDAQELVAAAKATGAKLAVNQTRRFFPTYQKIRELIATGKLGTIKEITYHDGIEFDWPAASPHNFLPGAKGAWGDTGVHLLDTVCYWLDGKPELVSSQHDGAGGPEAMATVRFRHQECEVEIKVSRLGRLMNGFRIVGTEASITAGAEDFAEITVQFNDGRKRTHKCGSKKLQYTDFAKPLLENFVDVVQGKAEPAVSGESTLATIDLLQAAYDHARGFDEPWNQYWTEEFEVVS